jgi:hypothetical protein
MKVKTKPWRHVYRDNSGGTTQLPEGSKVCARSRPYIETKPMPILHVDHNE